MTADHIQNLLSNLDVGVRGGAVELRLKNGYGEAIVRILPEMVPDLCVGLMHAAEVAKQNEPETRRPKP